VSRIAGLLDEQVQAFRERPLEGRYPYLFVDAKVEKVRDSGRVARKAVVIAHAVHETGRREIIGLDVGEAETEAFWRDLLRSLVARGLIGVELAISDAHRPSRARWRRSSARRGSAAPRTSSGICAATCGATSTTRSSARSSPPPTARRRAGGCVTPSSSSSGGCRRSPRCSRRPRPTCCFYAFPTGRWPKIRSTNPLERFNREIARRTDVVGIFPDDASLIRLVSMVAIEANDEWLVGRSYISRKSMATLRDAVSEKDVSPDQDKEVELIAAGAADRFIDSPAS